MDVREKLVDIVCDATRINGCIHSCNHPPCAMVRGIVDALIENGVTVQEWIPVKDRLPKETGRYLTVKKRIAPDYLGGNRTDIVILKFFVDKGFRMPTHIPNWINEEINDEVTHWMPLPQLRGKDG